MKIFLFTLAVFIAAFAGAQPLTQGELAWLTSLCSGTNYSGVAYYAIPENFIFTNFLFGGGTPPVTFSITTNPVHGVETLVTPSNGSNYYTPNLNYTGPDLFAYNVSSCPNKPGSGGQVQLTISATNSVSCATFIETNNNVGDESCNFVLFDVGEGLFSTNLDWYFYVTDSMAIVTPTIWFYTAGNNPANWCPGVSSGDSMLFFIADTTGCVPFGDIITGQLCPGSCGCVSLNISNVQYSISGIDNFGPPVSNLWSVGGGWTTSQQSDMSFSFLNVSGVTKTISMKGVITWATPASGLAEITVLTNGVQLYDSLFLTASGSTVSNYLITIPSATSPNACEAIDVREHIIYGGSTVTIHGNFTNTVF